MKFVRHQTPQDLARAGTRLYMRDCREHFKDMDSGDFACFAEDIGHQEARVFDACDWGGFYGFATNNSEIHYWAAAETPLEKLAYLLAHEAGHCVGKEAEDAQAEEERADTYALAIGEVLIELGLMSSRHRSCLEEGR